MLVKAIKKTYAPRDSGPITLDMAIITAIDIIGSITLNVAKINEFL
jgi:hypothetical protein